MHGGISPASPSASISKATTRGGCPVLLVHVTPDQVQKSGEALLFHVAMACVLPRRRDLRQSRASLLVPVVPSAGAAAHDKGYKADDTRRSMAKSRGETMLLVCNAVDMNEFPTVVLPLLLRGALIEYVDPY